MSIYLRSYTSLEVKVEDDNGQKVPVIRVVTDDEDLEPKLLAGRQLQIRFPQDKKIDFFLFGSAMFTDKKYFLGVDTTNRETVNQIILLHGVHVIEIPCTGIPPPEKLAFLQALDQCSFWKAIFENATDRITLILSKSAGYKLRYKSEKIV